MVQRQAERQHNRRDAHATQTEQMQRSTTRTLNKYQRDDGHYDVDHTHACRGEFGLRREEFVN